MKSVFACVTLCVVSLSPSIVTEPILEAEAAESLPSAAAPRPHIGAFPIAVAANFSPVPEREHRLDWYPPEAEAEADAPEPARTMPELICDTINTAAAAHALPVIFFTRLIWQESKFNPRAVSRAGARGVAQFMPGTARQMGLDNPFDPVEALPMSARLLRELYGEFGSWGLAAAAYNAGAGRVRQWLRRGGRLPRETRNYVRVITGVPAERWTRLDFEGVELKLPSKVPCVNMPSAEVHTLGIAVALSPTKPPRELLAIAEAAAEIGAGTPKPELSASARTDEPGDANIGAVAAGEAAPEEKSWQVRLGVHRSYRQAAAAFTRLRKRYRSLLESYEPIIVDAGRRSRRGARKHLQLAVESRASAEALCAQLKSAGPCIVRGN